MKRTQRKTRRKTQRKTGRKTRMRMRPSHDRRTNNMNKHKRKHKKAKFFKSFIKKSVTKMKNMRNIIFTARNDPEAFEVQNDYTPKVYTYLKRNYGLKIVALSICRTPIKKSIEAALNIVSFGKWSSERSKFGYDDFYHLFLIAETETGRRIVIEKNEVINVKDYPHAPSASDDCKEVDMTHGPLKLGPMLKKTETEMKDKDYFLYDSFNNNCQVFVENVLSANALLQPELIEFISQELGEVLKTQPIYMSSVARNVTDVRGRVKRFMKGKTERDEIKRGLRDRGSITSEAMESRVE